MQQNEEVIAQHKPAAKAMREARRGPQNVTIAAEALKSQRKKVRNFTRLTVTTCLYLSPSNRARSLSTLIAVVVDKEAPLKAKAAIV